MNVLLADLEADGRRRRGVAVLVVMICASGAGTWLTAPFGIALVARGEALGWVLTAAGFVLLITTVAGVLVIRRMRRVPGSLPGAPDPHSDETAASPDPRGGFSMNGSMLGSP